MDKEIGKGYNLNNSYCMIDKNKHAVDIYDSIAEDYAKRFDPIESDEDLRFPNRFLSHLQTGNSIIDLGCGTGFSAGYFSKHGMRVEGVDLSSSMITIAKRNYPELQFAVADMRTFSSNNPVDAVWAGYSLFHFEQTEFEKTLEQIKTYLKPQGIFGLVMQGGEGEIEIPEPFLPAEKIYIHLYSKEQLKMILEQHSFSVIDEDIKKATDYEFPYDKILMVVKRK